MLAKAKARFAWLASLVSITLLTASGQPRRDVGGSAVRGGNRLGNDPDAGVVLPPSTLRRPYLVSFQHRCGIVFPKGGLYEAKPWCRG